MLSVTKPTVGGSTGTWGNALNAAFDTITEYVNTTRPIVELKADCSAAVDGTTDDLPVVRSTLAAGGHIFLRPGNHLWKLTTSTLSIPAGTVVAGVPGETVVYLDSDVAATDRELWRMAGDGFHVSGIEFRRISNCGVVMFPLTPYAGLTVVDCVLDGQSSTHGTTHGAHGVKSGTAAGVASKVRFDRCTFRGLHFGWLQGTTDTGQTRDVRIRDCLFSGNFGDDLEFNGPSGAISDVKVTDSRFELNQSVTASSGFAVGAATVTDLTVRGCTMSDYYNEALHVEDTANDVKWEGNTLVDCGTGTGQWALVMSGTRDVKIRGNTFRSSTPTGSAAVLSVQQNATGTLPSGNAAAPPTGILFEGNTIDVGSGISGIYLDAITDVRIRGNRIRSTGAVSGTYSGPSTYAITANGCTDLQITGNRISGWRYGLNPQSGSTTQLGTGFVVEGNTFADCYVGLPLQNLGTGRVTDNTIRNCEIPAYAAYDGATVGTCVVARNHAVGCTNALNLHGSCPVVASADRATGTGVTMAVYAVTSALPSGTTIFFPGGGVFTTTAFAQVGASSVTGDLTGAAVASAEQGRARWAWSSSTSNLPSIVGNTDGTTGAGFQLVETGTDYRIVGHEEHVLCWASGITVTLPPAAFQKNRHPIGVSNTAGSTVGVTAEGGTVGGSAAYSLAAGGIIRVTSDGTNWILC